MTVSIEQVKAELWQVEAELLSYIPNAAVRRRWPHVESSYLIECEHGGAYFWPGAAQVEIDPDTDTAAIIDAVVAAWSGRDGWTVSRSAQGHGRRHHLKLVRDDGLHFSVMNLEGNTVLRIVSYTGCLPVDAVDPNRRY